MDQYPLLQIVMNEICDYVVIIYEKNQQLIINVLKAHQKLEIHLDKSTQLKIDTYNLVPTILSKSQFHCIRNKSWSYRNNYNVNDVTAIKIAEYTIYVGKHNNYLQCDALLDKFIQMYDEITRNDGDDNMVVIDDYQRYFVQNRKQLIQKIKLWLRKLFHDIEQQNIQDVAQDSKQKETPKQLQISNYKPLMSPKQSPKEGNNIIYTVLQLSSKIECIKKINQTVFDRNIYFYLDNNLEIRFRITSEQQIQLSCNKALKCYDNRKIVFFNEEKHRFSGYLAIKDIKQTFNTKHFFIFDDQTNIEELLLFSKDIFDEQQFVPIQQYILKQVQQIKQLHSSESETCVQELIAKRTTKQPESLQFSSNSEANTSISENSNTKAQTNNNDDICHMEAANNNMLLSKSNVLVCSQKDDVQFDLEDNINQVLCDCKLENIQIYYNSVLKLFLNFYKDEIKICITECRQQTYVNTVMLYGLYHSVPVVDQQFQRIFVNVKQKQVQFVLYFDYTYKISTNRTIITRQNKIVPQITEVMQILLAIEVVIASIKSFQFFMSDELINKYGKWLRQRLSGRLLIKNLSQIDTKYRIYQLEELVQLMSYRIYNEKTDD